MPTEEMVTKREMWAYRNLAYTRDATLRTIRKIIDSPDDNDAKMIRVVDLLNGTGYTGDYHGEVGAPV
jgi:hypothetical protein